MILSLAFLIAALVLAICAAVNVTATPHVSLGWTAFALYLASLVVGRF